MAPGAVLGAIVVGRMGGEKEEGVWEGGFEEMVNEVKRKACWLVHTKIFSVSSTFRSWCKSETDSKFPQPIETIEPLQAR